MDSPLYDLCCNLAFLFGFYLGLIILKSVKVALLTCSQANDHIFNR